MAQPNRKGSSHSQKGDAVNFWQTVLAAGVGYVISAILVICVAKIVGLIIKGMDK